MHREEYIYSSRYSSRPLNHSCAWEARKVKLWDVWIFVTGLDHFINDSLSLFFVFMEPTPAILLPVYPTLGNKHGDVKQLNKFFKDPFDIELFLCTCNSHKTYNYRWNITRLLFLVQERKFGNGSSRILVIWSLASFFSSLRFCWLRVTK